MAMDEALGGLDPAIEVESGDNRLADIAEHAGDLAGARDILARRQDEVAAEIDGARHLGQGLAPHELGVAPRQRPLVLVGEAPPQELGDDQAEHAVAEELKPLVTLIAAAAAALTRHRAGMGERLGPQLRAREAMAQRRGQSVRDTCRLAHLIPSKGRS
jgi:hypothetical protein